MELTFLGGARTVTGSRHLVDTGRARVLVDCGMFQGGPDEAMRTWSLDRFEARRAWALSAAESLRLPVPVIPEY